MSPVATVLAQPKSHAYSPYLDLSYALGEAIAQAGLNLAYWGWCWQRMHRGQPMAPLLRMAELRGGFDALWNKALF